MFLLDSDVLIGHLRGKPVAPVPLDDLLLEGPLCASTLTRFEVLRGAFANEVAATLSLLDALEPLEVDAEVADVGSALWADYRRRGRQLPSVDCLIAATAIVHDLTLVTGNLKDYPMPQLRILGRDTD